MGIWVYESDESVALTRMMLQGGNGSVEVEDVDGGKTGIQCGDWRPTHCSIFIGASCRHTLEA